MMHSKLILGVVTLLPSLMLRAQSDTPVQPPTPSAKTRSAEADKVLSSWLMAGCNNEVAIARVAVARSQDAEVKKFAQKMIDDHSKLALKLLPFTGSAVDAPARDTDDEERVDRDTNETRAKVAAEGFDHVALIHDLSKRCLESQETWLEGKTKAEFDHCFMQAQVGLHTQAVILAEVSRKYASDELRPILDLAGKSLSAHLEQAMTLCKKCESVAKVGRHQDSPK
jgi:predicted outer membrane protein